MKIRQIPAKYIGLALLIASHLPMLQAQNSNNILGLPAVPQIPQVPQAAGSGMSAAAKPASAPAKPMDSEIKSAVSGNIKLASFYQEGLVTVRVATDKTYTDSAPRAQALQAARLIQRDIRLACGKLCKPGPMPAPTLQADNTLSFDLVISGYSGILSTTDMVNLVNARAISAGGKAVAAPVRVVPSPAAPATIGAPVIAVPLVTSPAGAAPASAATEP